MTVQACLVGFGHAGRVLHAPLITAAPGINLAAIVTSRAAEATAAYPTARVAPDLAEGLDGIDVVIIATPNDSHVHLARQALAGGKAVVIDKPMAPSLQDAVALAREARAAGRLLTVFHNRRWDGDFQALRQILADGALGRIAAFESRFDRFRPIVQDRWREVPGPAAGLWWDLGPHLLDQALQLFGPPQAVLADLAIRRPGGQVTDDFHVVLDYPDRRVVLGASSLAAAETPRFRIEGDGGAAIIFGKDGQEAQLRAGAAAAAGQTGHLTRMHGDFALTQDIDVAPGRYVDFYAGVAQAVAGKAPSPVALEDALLVMRLLELAETSARERRLISLSES